MNADVAIDHEAKARERTLANLYQELLEAGHRPSIAARRHLHVPELEATLKMLPLVQTEADRQVLHRLIAAYTAQAEAEAAVAHERIEGLRRQRQYADERYALQGRL